MTNHKPFFGFTLAELLIALAILGIIATFTIPKVLQSQQDNKNRAIAKEAMAAVASAYQAYKLTNVVDANTTFGALTPYLNYVALDTTSTLDFTPCAGTLSCTANGYRCLKLHNGAYLYYVTGIKFDGATTLNALQFNIDPDGENPSATGHAGKALSAYLYMNGNLRTRPDILTGTTNSVGTDNPSSACEPDWFSWN